MEERKYLKDILLQKKPFEFTNDKGEKVTMYECYSRTEEPFDENGYFVKHFYVTADKIEGVNIGDTIKVRFSRQYRKFYVGD